MKQQYIYYNAHTDILFHIPYKKIAPIHIRHYLTLQHHRLTPLPGGHCSWMPCTSLPPSYAHESEPRANPKRRHNER